MEHFGARDERPAEECVRIVREESDVFVGIYAHRYGFVPDGSSTSISEMEYLAASEVSLPRFIYVVDENHPWLPGCIDTGTSRDRLVAFKASLLKRHICQPFQTKDELATKVVAALGRHIALRGATKVGPGIPVPDIGIQSMANPAVETPDEWNARRRDVYKDNRGVFLTHIIQPSSRPDQTFDVYIYLIRHKSEDLSDVLMAEFFLGPYWDNAIFPAFSQNGFIGISTSAYGTFLCVCRVTFLDGTQIYLDRYIDFEMARTGGESFSERTTSARTNSH